MTATAERTAVELTIDGETVELDHGAVVIAAITSCTNTSNPAVMIAAGLLAKKAVERGPQRRPWVKTSLAPGSKVVTEYFEKAGLTPYLEALGFHTVGYGCTTCIGNSGPLPEAVSQAVAEGDLVACAVLSGNRNFEARIHPEVKANYLASPPLVVAYALAGRMDVDLSTEPLGHDPRRRAGLPGRHLALARRGAGDDGERDRARDVPRHLRERLRGRGRLARAAGADRRALRVGGRRRPTSAGRRTSTAWRLEPARSPTSRGARCLVSIGDSVTTDHISPAGSIKLDSPAGRYLVEHGVEPAGLQLVRLAPRQPRGDGARHVRERPAAQPARARLGGNLDGAPSRTGEEMTIFDAAERYLAEGTPTIVLAGKEYGSGSSRDWAAKGPNLLGVRAVIAESYERIHRSNLLMMGILPLQFLPGESRESLGLTGREEFSVTGVENGEAREVTVTRRRQRSSGAILRLDTPREREYVRHGGILPYVLRRPAGRRRPSYRLVNGNDTSWGIEPVPERLRVLGGSTSACSGATSASRCSSSWRARSSCRRCRCRPRSSRSSSAASSGT